MNSERGPSWAETYRKGLWRYIVVNGVLRLGVPFGALMLMGRYLSFPVRVGWDGFPLELFRFIFEALTFGVAVALWTWHQNKKRYKIR